MLGGWRFGVATVESSAAIVILLTGQAGAGAVAEPGCIKGQRVPI
ncbi:hypothetical protein ARTHRO9V_20155 [Arthrobacter sp. 9V]|nr:hypothetical protein ARTHRO9V_20155 [Arthrobacter sp. 9V]